MWSSSKAVYVEITVGKKPLSTTGQLSLTVLAAASGISWWPHHSLNNFGVFLKYVKYSKIYCEISQTLLLSCQLICFRLQDVRPLAAPHPATAGGGRPPHAGGGRPALPAERLWTQLPCLCLQQVSISVCLSVFLSVCLDATYVCWFDMGFFSTYCDEFDPVVAVDGQILHYVSDRVFKCSNSNENIVQRP